LRQLFVSGIVLGIVIEVFTSLMRFYFGLESTNDTAVIGKFTGGIRIHHGYIGGLLMFGAAFNLQRTKSWSDRVFKLWHWFFIIGIGLVISDFVHHFIVLQLAIGHPQFDLVYP
jgi:uncharacterized membrane protein YidH (DUF202 family)